ncbi:MAG: hypothetical protein ACI4LB_02530 [Candidatus Fimenecus sp.]
MTKAKKVLSLVLAVVMVATMFAFSAYASNENATFTVSVDQATVDVDGIVTVTVALRTDYYAGPTNVPVYYDPAVFQFVEGSVSAADLFGTGATDVYSNNDADTGCLKVAFIPLSASDNAAAQIFDGTLFTFQLKAIANGTSDIGLKADDQKTSDNITGTLYCGAYKSSDIDNNPATVGQVFTINNTSATVGSAATPEIVAKDGTTGYVDAARMYVYGVTAGDVAANYFEATNGGTLTWDVGTAASENGTGATVTLKDSKGTDVATYTLIIFGDMDGTGVVDGTDSISIMQYVADSATNPLTAVQLFAGDLDVSGAVDGTDSISIMQYVADSASNPLTVNPYAA